MKKVPLSALLACVVGLFLVIGDAFAAEKAPAVLVLKAGRITGKVADSIGSAVPKARVQVVGKGAKAEIVAVTAKDGAFALELKPGKYTLTIADKLSLPLEVSKDGEVVDLVLMIPMDNPYSAAQGGWTFGAVDWGLIGSIAAITTVPISVYAASEAKDAADDAEDVKKRLSP